MRFNRNAFNQAILLYSRQHHMKIGKVEQDLAETIYVNIEALRNWRKGSNGPGGDSYIKAATSFLGVSDWTTLFTETDGGKV